MRELSMGGFGLRRLLVFAVVAGVVSACAAAPPPSTGLAPQPAAPTSAPSPAVAARPAPAPAPPHAPAAPVEPLPESFESDDFVVVLAKAGDTAESLAQRHLGDRTKAWMIEDYNGAASFTAGREVVVPKRAWNPSGVEPRGYQLVPILCYHNLGPQTRGRLVMSASAFEEQMRYLKREGYHVITLRQFLEFTALRRQLPRKTVVLTFDDGWRSFKEFAYPILKELGYPATLFIYTDFIGARIALSWAELKELAQEGFDVQAHSKTHEDMRRKPTESEDEYTRRMQAELVQPMALFQQRVGQPPRILAYPYGAHDEGVVKRVREAGYIAALDVRRQGNPSFTPALTIHRAQIYSEMSLDDFIRNLTVFSEETIR
jgi:peptidoglycan/xylan/chitin deacetylase (PgdA/CDA1 family)